VPSVAVRIGPTITSIRTPWHTLSVVQIKIH
jgi:hypothetical protein